jgi:hypothetical protein
MSKYCGNIACLLFFFTKQNTKKTSQKATKQRKHFKPSLSIENLQKKNVPLVFLSFHSPRAVVAAFLRARCILPSPCVLKNSQKKRQRKKETVLTTARARAAVESTRRTKEEFIIVMFIF